MTFGATLNGASDWVKRLCPAKSDRETQISCDITYVVESKTKGTNQLSYKIEIELQMEKIDLWLPGSKGEG